MSESDELAGEALQKLWEQMATCPDSPRLNLQHDPTARVFRLTAADSTVGLYCDNPARHLSVEPEPQIGAMRPVRKLGWPVFRGSSGNATGRTAWS